jgi:hypothetical protein
MTDASNRLINLGRQILEPYIKLPGVRAAMITGSAAEGISDFYSDLDTTVYWDSFPDPDAFEACRHANGGGPLNWIIGDRNEGSFAESYHVNRVECQIGHATLETWQKDMDEVLVDFNPTTVNQKAVWGTSFCIPVFGEDLINAWKARIANYPDGLRLAMVKHFLALSPSWGITVRVVDRDSSIWQRQLLVDSCHNLFGVLAGLNRVYYSSFQFKRMSKFIDSLAFTPDHLRARTEKLFQVPFIEAAEVMRDLIGDAVVLVESQLPDVDTSKLRHRLEWRQVPWHP